MRDPYGFRACPNGAPTAPPLAWKRAQRHRPATRNEDRHRTAAGLSCCDPAAGSRRDQSHRGRPYAARRSSGAAPAQPPAHRSRQSSALSRHASREGRRLSHALPRARRRIKVHGGSLGAFLCWAVVFADIGTSIYYVPGILYGPFGSRAALFVLMTLFVFILLCVKYAEVTWRYPEGGGVVNVSSQALHPFVGLLGGLFILVDYYLTAALSALSGVLYLAVVAPVFAPPSITLTATVGALVILGLLNAFGIKESARTTAFFASIAAGAQLLVVIAVAISLGPSGILHSFRALTSGPSIPLSGLVIGYAAAFLAFSGLESIAQLAPAMREPRRMVATRAMLAVVMTMAITSPLLTLWSTTLLGPHDDPNQFISILGAHVAGRVFGGFVAVSGSLLLVFASNTAIIGAYHVFIALTRMGFLPRVMEVRNHWRRTPHWAILAAVLLPIIVVVGANAQVNVLGDLYAFVLLGTFVLTCVSLDA